MNYITVTRANHHGTASSVTVGLSSRTWQVNFMYENVEIKIHCLVLVIIGWWHWSQLIWITAFTAKGRIYCIFIALIWITAFLAESRVPKSLFFALTLQYFWLIICRIAWTVVALFQKKNEIGRAILTLISIN